MATPRSPRHATPKPDRKADRRNGGRAAVGRATPAQLLSGTARDRARDRRNEIHPETAGVGATGTAPPSRGMEEPREIATSIALVERSFAFVDLCGFTKFIAANGEHAAIETLTQFRTLTRDISNRRGVMVAKWLGDGAMIVGVEIGPTVATAAELIGRYDGSTLALRGGFANGQTLIMDGDDYIGRPANLAARLCQAAKPEELLAVGLRSAALPSWIRVDGLRSVTLPGLGRVRRVQSLELIPDLELPRLVAGGA